MNLQEHLHNRYPGIRSFEATERELFFGREREVQELYSLIKVQPFAVLFAKSGIGKTSLLNAGVMPLLSQGEYYPIKVRFQNTGLSPADSLLQAVEQLAESLWLQDHSQQRLQQKVQGRAPLLWEQLKSYDFEGQRQVTPILIFDQFEEFFNHKPEDQQVFVECLADLMYQRTPKLLLDEQTAKVVTSDLDFLDLPLDMGGDETDDWTDPLRWKIVIAIRSDRLSFLDNLSKSIPAILSNRYQLHPMHWSNAEKAVTEPAQLDGDHYLSPRFSYQADTLASIQDALSNTQGEIESFQLQIICQHIENQVIKNRKENKDTHFVTPDYLGGKEGIQHILNGYYERQIASVGSEVEQLLARKLIEEGLIVEGARVSLAESILLTRYKIPPTLLAKLLDTRLIRIENTHLGRAYEVSHDTLVEPILESYSKRAQREHEAMLRQRAEEQQRLLQQQAQEHQAQTRRQRRVTIGVIVVAGFMAAAFVYAWRQGAATEKALQDNIRINYRANFQRGMGLHFIENDYQKAHDAYSIAHQNALRLDGMRDTVQLITDYQRVCASMMSDTNTLRQQWFEWINTADSSISGGVVALDQAMAAYIHAADLGYNQSAVTEIFSRYNTGILRYLSRSNERAKGFRENPGIARSLGADLLAKSRKLCEELIRVHDVLLRFYQNNKAYAEFAYQDQPNQLEKLLETQKRLERFKAGYVKMLEELN